MATMELFPRKNYKETYAQQMKLNTAGIIYVGDAEEKEGDKGKVFKHVEARITQYTLADGSTKVNELGLIETDTANGLKGFEKIMDYDILNERLGARLLPSVLISFGENYAYIYSGSRQSQIYLYQFETSNMRISRVAFDANLITTEDLWEVIDRVFISPEKENILLRANPIEVSR